MVSIIVFTAYDNNILIRLAGENTETTCQVIVRRAWPDLDFFSVPAAFPPAVKFQSQSETLICTNNSQNYTIA